MRLPPSRAPILLWPIRLSVGLLLVSLSQSAFAEADSNWSIPTDCGNRRAFEQALRERIGTEADLLLADTTVNITEADHSYTMTVRVGQKERVLSDPNCQDLFRASVVVAIAVYNAPEKQQSAPPPNDNEPSPPPSKPSAYDPPLAAPQPSVTPVIARPKPKPIKQTGSQFLFGAELGLSKGMVPELKTVLGTFGAFETQQFGIELLARYIPKSEKKDDQGKGVSVYALGSALSAYYKPDPVFGVGGGFFIYRLTGHGIGSEANTSSNIVALGPQIGLWVTPLEYGPFLLRASAGAQFNALRSRFEIVDYTDVFRSSRVVFEGGLKAGLKF
jgi:hypothetical protein